jgi:hypothetical protein
VIAEVVVRMIMRVVVVVVMRVRDPVMAVGVALRRRVVVPVETSHG